MAKDSLQVLYSLGLPRIKRSIVPLLHISSTIDTQLEQDEYLTVEVRVAWKGLERYQSPSLRIGQLRQADPRG